jgi:hypothetical protein
MTSQELRLKEKDLKKEYELNLQRIKNEFVQSNKKFNVGDFVGNVTGIIKVNSISYEDFMGTTEIVYIGYRYRKLNGNLIRTKDKKLSKLTESHNLIKIDGIEQE